MIHSWVRVNEILYQKKTMLCLLKVYSNTIILTLHFSYYSVKSYSVLLEIYSLPFLQGVLLSLGKRVKRTKMFFYKKFDLFTTGNFLVFLK